MKQMTKQMILIATMIGASFTAQAGVSSSGGGNSVVCRDANKQIKSAELLDFYEGRAMKGLNIVKSDAKVDDQISAALTKMNGNKPDDVSTGIVQQVQATMVLLPAGVGLQPVGDANTIILPKDCAIEQVADYRDQEDKLYIDTEIWNAFGPTDKAGLMIHETLYLFARGFGEETTSERVRQEVARSFSDVQIPAVSAGVPDGAWNCTTADDSDAFTLGTSFWAYNNKDGALIFQFSTFAGHMMFEKSTATINLFSNGADNKLPIDGGGENGIGYAAMDSAIDQGLLIELTFGKDPSGAEKMYIGQGDILHPSKDKTEFTCKKDDGTKMRRLK